MSAKFQAKVGWVFFASFITLISMLIVYRLYRSSNKVTSPTSLEDKSTAVITYCSTKANEQQALKNRISIGTQLFETQVKKTKDNSDSDYKPYAVWKGESPFKSPKATNIDLALILEQLPGTSIIFTNIGKDNSYTLVSSRELPLGMTVDRKSSNPALCKLAQLSAELIKSLSSDRFEEVAQTVKNLFFAGRYHLAGDLDNLASRRSGFAREKIESEIGLGVPNFEKVKRQFNLSSPDERSSIGNTSKAQLEITFTNVGSGSHYLENRIEIDVADIATIMASDYLWYRQGSGSLDECLCPQGLNQPETFCQNILIRAGYPLDADFSRQCTPSSMKNTGGGNFRDHFLLKDLRKARDNFGSVLLKAYIEEIRYAMRAYAIALTSNQKGCLLVHDVQIVKVDDDICSSTKDAMPVMMSFLKRDLENGISPIRLLFAHELAHYFLNHSQERLKELYHTETHESFENREEDSSKGLCSALTILEAEADIASAMMLRLRDEKEGLVDYWGKELNPHTGFWEDEQRLFFNLFSPFFDGLVSLREFTSEKCSHYWAYSRYILFVGIYLTL